MFDSACVAMNRDVVRATTRGLCNKGKIHCLVTVAVYAS
jgi:hypothetical protein